VFPLDAFKFGFAARTAQILGLHVVECKARFSSLYGSALATHSMSTGLGQIMAGGSGRRTHGTANTSSLTSLLSARRLLGRLLRRWMGGGLDRMVWCGVAWCGAGSLLGVGE